MSHRCAKGAVVQVMILHISRKIRSSLLRRGVNPHDIDDIIQDAFQRLEIYKQSQIVTNAEGFLMRTAINLSIDLQRKKRRANLSSEPVESMMIVDEAPKPDEVYAARRRLDRLNEGFARLDPITREMIRLQRMEGMTVAAIADLHKLSVSATEKRLARGMLSLMQWMEGW